MKKLLNILGIIAVLIIGALIISMISVEAGVVGAMAIAVYARSCAKNVAGNTAVFLGEAPNISSITVTSGEVAAITMDSGKTFMKIGADLDGISRTEVGVGTINNMSYVHRIEMLFAKPATALNVLRDSLTAASPCGILGIVQDANGESWLVGYNETDEAERPMRLVDDNVNSGSAPDDAEGQRASINLECKNGYVALPFDATEKAAILGGTATYISYS